MYLRDRLWGAIFAKQYQGRVARGEMNEEEHAHRHQKGDGQHQEKSAQDVGRHAGRTSGINLLDAAFAQLFPTPAIRIIRSGYSVNPWILLLEICALTPNVLNT